jgi:hypothetical protein
MFDFIDLTEARAKQRSAPRPDVVVLRALSEQFGLQSPDLDELVLSIEQAEAEYESANLAGDGDELRRDAHQRAEETNSAGIDAQLERIRGCLGATGSVNHLFSLAAQKAQGETLHRAA